MPPKRKPIKKCIHGKDPYVCKPCGGKGICIHDKIKSLCKQCGGKGLCPHGRPKSRCKPCGGKGLCQHGRIKSRCKPCGGHEICEHNKQRSRCATCGGNELCKHKILRTFCKECGGGSLCIHLKVRSKCRECKGNSICLHDKLKTLCIECGGGSLCDHKIERSNCVTCNPKIACTECKFVRTYKKSQYYPYCQACYCVKYPDCPKSSNFKLKERILRDKLREYFPEECIEMFFDQRVDGGCSGRKPDVLIDMLTFSIVIECDEFQHKAYDTECENKRMMQLFEDLGSRPLVMIRFNPDAYVNDEDEKVGTCFKPLTTGEDANRRRFYDIQEEEWEYRCQVLKGVIVNYLEEDGFPLQEITVIKLFYDGYSASSAIQESLSSLKL